MLENPTNVGEFRAAELGVRVIPFFIWGGGGGKIFGQQSNVLHAVLMCGKV